MKLIGDLKNQVDSVTDINLKKTLIEKAGMALTDDELEMVAGGINSELTELDEEGEDIGGLYVLYQ